MKTIKFFVLFVVIFMTTSCGFSQIITHPNYPQRRQQHYYQKQQQNRLYLSTKEIRAAYGINRWDAWAMHIGFDITYKEIVWVFETKHYYRVYNLKGQIMKSSTHFPENVIKAPEVIMLYGKHYKASRYNRDIFLIPTDY